MTKAPFYMPVIHILLIVVLGLIAYSNTFYVPFHFDDESFVEDYKLKDLSNFWPPSESRWVSFLTFALNYKLHRFNVTGYHIVNVTIHIINALLVYYLVVLTFRTPYLSNLWPVASNQKKTDSPIRPFTDSSSFIALSSALLFVSHPIQTQAVTYIVQRFASLATMFYLLSLVMYIKARLSTLHAARYTLYAISLTSAILAMKTKEISFTLPFVIILYEFSFLSQPLNPELRTSNLKRFLYLLPFLLILLIIPLNIIGVDKPISEDIIGELKEASQETEQLSRLSYLFTQFRVIVTYIRLLFLPINQNLDYDYPIYDSFLESQVMLSFLFLLGIFVFAVYLFYISRVTYRSTFDITPPSPPLNLGGGRVGLKGGMEGFDAHSPIHSPRRVACGDRFTYFRLISFGIFWFFITLLVESSVIPIRDVIFEHRVYLPSVGVFIAVSTVFFTFSRGVKQRWMKAGTVVLMAVMIVILTGATYTRNIVWRDGVSLWKDVVSKSPKKSRGYNNLGNAYKAKGLFDIAIGHYLHAVDLMPDYAEAYVNLGSIYNDIGQIDRAIEQYQNAIKLKPDIPKAYYNLGIAYHNKGWVDKAIEQYQIALRFKPDYAEAYYNLGNAYYSKGLIDNAIELYLQAIRLNPNIPEAYYNLGSAYFYKGMVNKAIEYYGKAINLRPNNPDAHYNLGVAYRRKGQIDKAEEHLRIAEALRMQRK